MIKKSATAWSVDDVFNMTTCSADKFSVFASFHDTWEPTKKTRPKPETNTPSNGGSSDFPSDSLPSGSSAVLAMQWPDYRLVDINAHGCAHWRDQKMTHHISCQCWNFTRDSWRLIRRRRIARLLIRRRRNVVLIGVCRFSNWWYGWLIWQTLTCVSIIQRLQW